MSNIPVKMEGQVYDIRGICDTCNKVTMCRELLVNIYCDDEARIAIRLRCKDCEE